MVRDGDMVRARGGRMMRVANVFRDLARCIYVDEHGRIHQRFCYLDELEPFWLASGPRSLWPEISELPELAPVYVVPKSGHKASSRKPRPSKRARPS